MIIASVLALRKSFHLSKIFFEKNKKGVDKGLPL